MGCSFNQYLIRGVKMPFDKPDDLYDSYHENGYKEGIVHKNGLAVVSDGMDNKYTFVGRILQKSPLGYPLDGIFGFEEADGARRELIADLINMSLPHLKHIGSKDIKQWFVTHWH